MKFRKKPVVIEATQWFKNGDHPLDYSSTHDELENGEPRQFSPEERKANNWEGDIVRYYRHPEVPGERTCMHCEKTMHDHGWIETLEGGHIVCPGDWIITGVAGEMYPCKPDIFAATYEPCVCMTVAQHERIMAAWQRTQSAWVPVSERLPNIAEEVIVSSEFDGVTAGFLDSYGEWYSPNSDYKLTRVVAWQPLPVAPAQPAAQAQGRERWTVACGHWQDTTLAIHGERTGHIASGIDEDAAHAIVNAHNEGLPPIAAASTGQEAAGHEQ